MQEGIYHDDFEGHAHPLEAENKRIRAELAALKEAVRPVAEWWKNDGPFLRANTAEQLDALAALVGGEK